MPVSHASPFSRPRRLADVPGDVPPPSFDAVCRAHGSQIARWAERLGGPGLDADETVQEVFLVVARRLPEFRGEARITTWLFRITTRVLANQRRSARRRHRWARLTRRIEDLTASDAPGPGDALERREASRRFYAALELLPERYREVLVLFELEDLGTEEIARLMERPPATVRVWLHRARTSFIAAWQQQNQKENGA
ncbi:MAG: sigma-70 family RNA polymerase sigma factor [Myxococcales bacterium]